MTAAQRIFAVIKTMAADSDSNLFRSAYHNSTEAQHFRRTIHFITGLMVFYTSTVGRHELLRLIRLTSCHEEFVSLTSNFDIIDLLVFDFKSLVILVFFV